MPESLSSWLGLLERRHPKSIDLGLDRCRAVWRAMGSPRPAPRVVTVGGTNGKGSAVAYLRALLGSAGLRVASYTSPHVLRFNERLRLPQGMVSDAALVAAFERVDRARGDVSLTYFEFTTLAIFQLMREASLDWAVLEVGLGGRLDTVNLVDADGAVIMPVGIDHQEYLGADRESIGAEKAGILREGAPLVCGDREPPETVMARAHELGVPTFILGVDFDVDSTTGTFRFPEYKTSWLLPVPPLPGTHQYDNMATAIAAVQVMAPKALEQPDAWTRALSSVRVTGRLSRHPGDTRVLLDVGHNPLAAEVVARALAELGEGGVHCVLGMLRDKDAETAAAILAPRVCHWYLAGLGGPRGQTGSDLKHRLKAVLGGASLSSFPRVAEALHAARKNAGEQDRILVFGSFETVASAIRALDGE